MSRYRLEAMANRDALNYMLDESRE